MASRNGFRSRTITKTITKVAAINSVYMDQEEEDAMLEAIQGIDLLLAS